MACALLSPIGMALLKDEMAVPNAHPRGARPFGPKEYEQKFRTLTKEIIEKDEVDRFVNLANALGDLTVDEVRELLPVMQREHIVNGSRDNKGFSSPLACIRVR